VLKSPRPAAPLAFGVLNGFLPCPLVYAFAVQAAASGGALPGLAVMLAFGLGTFPAMLAMASAGAWVRAGPVGVARWRLQGVRAAGAFIVALGLITLARGVSPLTALVHGA
jgi:sulfite exporter TauE/SafE